MAHGKQQMTNKWKMANNKLENGKQKMEKWHIVNGKWQSWKMKKW